MRLLFVHQNFPGQFLYLAPALRQRGHDVQALSAESNKRASSVPMHKYKYEAGPFNFQTHGLAAHFAEQTARGSVAAAAAAALRDRHGYSPDVVIGHPGWGETLFLRDIWPQAKHIMYGEFFYAPHGLDVDFDPEFYKPSTQRDFWVTARQAPQLMALNQADCVLSPTQWQASTYPAAYRGRMKVIHDGVNMSRLVAGPDICFEPAGTELKLRPGDEVLTFLSRNLEPYRGYHIFMRALPEVLAARPNAQVIITGEDGVSYGAKAPDGKSWKQIFLDEAGAKLDLSRIHFTGRIPHEKFVQLMHISRVHAYLTYPFVLSWSMLEAMAAGALVIGSRTPPVQEIIEHGQNGLLVDFFDIEAWSKTLIDALANPQKFTALRTAAKRTIEEKYDLHRICLPAQIKLIEGI